MASTRTSALQGRTVTRIRIQAIDVDLSSPPEYPIGLKLLLNDQLHQRMQPVLTTSSLHWDNVDPIDAKPADQVELRIYEYHMFGYRKIRIGAVLFRANQFDHLSTELIVVDNTGLVPCSVKFTLPSLQAASSIPQSVYNSAAAAVYDKPSVLESMGKARDVVGAILKIGEQVSELNPIAKVTFGLCNLAWQTLEKQDEYDKLLVDLVLAMGNLLPLVEALKGQARVEWLQATIIEILKLIEDASRFVIDYESNGAAVRTVSAFVSSTAQGQVDEFVKQFKRLREEFDTGMTAQVVLGVEMALKDTDQEMIIKLIVPEAAYNPAAGCLEGTRTTVQDEIREWANTEGVSPSIYWISGLAGCGKSTIAHSACRWLDANGSLAGSFFCKRDKEQLSKPENIVSTLAANIGFQCQQYGVQLVAALRKDPRITTKAFQTRFEEMIIQPIQSMSVNAPLPTSFISVDALDECGTTETRTELVKYLTKLVRLAPWIKLLVTSRPDHKLEPFLKNEMVLHRDLSNDYKTSVAGDIERLIRHRLKALMEDDEMLGSKPWLKDGSVTRLTTQANELFIWAQTACNIISKSPNPERKIHEMLSGGTSQDATAQLHSLYSRILHEALDDIGGGVDIIKSCIAGVVVTRTPLTDADLAKLLEKRVELIELRRIIRQLSSVLYRDHSGAIRVIHQSFSDYMLAEQCPVEYRIDNDRENLDLGASCLRIIVDELKFNICQLEDSTLFNQEVADLSDRIQRNIPVYLEYSCVHWVDHLTVAKGSSIISEHHQSTLMILAQLLRGLQALYWVEVMSLLGKLHEGELALMELSGWIQDHALQQCAEELQQFITNYFLPISQSTPHLYISAIALGGNAWDKLKGLQSEFVNAVKLVQGQNLAKLSNRWSRTIPHSTPVRAITYSPSGKLLLTASEDGVRVFNATTGVTLFSLSHDEAVNSVAFSPDGQRVVSGSDDGKVRLWDIETWSLAFDPLSGHTDSVMSVTFSPDGQLIISGSKDKTVRVWDAHADPSLLLVLDHPESVRSIAFSPNNCCFVSGSYDGTVRLWDMPHSPDASPKLLRGSQYLIDSVAFSPDGQHIAAASYRSAFIWNALSGVAIHNIRHSRAINAVRFSPDSQHLVCGVTDGSIRVYHVQNGTLAFDPLLGHSQEAISVAFSPDGLRIASGSTDCTVLLWDARAHSTFLNPLQGHSESVYAAACSPDGRYIATGSEDQTVRLWSAHTGAPLVGPIDGHSGGVLSVAFSPDSQHVASGSRDETVRVWNTETGSATLGPLYHSNEVETVTFSSGGQWIISSDEASIRLWDAKSGASLLELCEGFPGVPLGVYSPDGRRILSTFQRWRPLGSVSLLGWDAITGALVQSFESKPLEDVSAVVLSPNGCYLAVGTRRGHIHVWDIDTNVLIFELGEALPEGSFSLAFSPDGRKVAALASYGELRVYDAQSGQLFLGPVGLKSSLPTSIVFSSDCQRIVSGHFSGSVHVWDISEASIPKSEESTHSLHSILLGSQTSSYELSEYFTSEGWVQNSDEKPVLWLPFIYRRFDVDDSLFAISKWLSEHPVSFDFSRFQYGKNWASIRTTGFVDA